MAAAIAAPRAVTMSLSMSKGWWRCTAAKTQAHGRGAQCSGARSYAYTG